jgi:hypothetical protein
MQAAAAANGAGDVQKPQQQPLVAGAPPPPPPAAVVPPHWVAMPFAPPPGAAAMVMQPHHMAPPPPQFAPTHFVPFHAVAPPRAQSVPAAVALGSPAPHQPGQEENKSVWVGDLHYWMDENYLHSCFGYTGEVSTDARDLLPRQPRSWPRHHTAPRNKKNNKFIYQKRKRRCFFCTRP